MSAQASKYEFLKRYLEPARKSRKKGDKDTVKYISGDLPESLDALCGPEGEKVFVENEDELNTNAPTIVRKKAAKPSAEEEKAQLEKSKKEAELKAKYDIWSKGVKTLEQQAEQRENEAYESSKPLARYADDADLAVHLKSQIHADDPMAQYFKSKAEKDKKKAKKHSNKKRKHSGDSASASSESSSEEEEDRPRYKGPEPPPNRYGIPPGYRWDGVDRSNGFEKKIVEESTRRQLERQIYQRWAMEDM